MNQKEKQASCQIAFTPIESSNYKKEISKVIDIIKGSGLEYEIGIMSTVVTSDKSKIMKLIDDIFENMNNVCGFVMDVKISNICGCEMKEADKKPLNGEPPKTIDAYIAEQPDIVRPFLNKIRTTLLETLPDAEECISWRMPTYRGKQNIIHFAAHKKHIGLYPGVEAIEYFADRLSEYKTSKGAVQFPYNEPLPVDLISAIAKWCYETGNHP